MLKILVMSCLLCAVSASAQVITTVAGTSYLFPTQPLPAISTPLGRIGGVAIDAKGNLYVSDQDDNIVVLITPNGTLSVFAGNGVTGFSGDGGPATSASLNKPTGLALDTSGNLYIADTFGGRIRKVSGGLITTVAGGGTNQFGDGGSATGVELLEPIDVKVDSAGNLYIVEFTGNRVRKVTGGIITTIAGNATGGFSGDGGPATSAQFAGPSALAMDSTGTLYIADEGNNRIRKVAGGVITTAVTGLSDPTGVALDPTGTLYISNTFAHRVLKFSAGTLTPIAGTGQPGFTGDNGPAISASVALPAGLALDSSGTLYIADSGNLRVRRINSAGVISTVAGNGTFRFSPDGVPAVSVPLDNPYTVAVDSSGNLYIADTGHSRVRKVSKGIISTIAGNGTSHCVQGANGGICSLPTPYAGNPATSVIVDPNYVAVDSVGNVYISAGIPGTISNGLVYKVSNGTITTVAGGLTGALGLGDGGPATSAALSPGGIAVDAAGNLFIADFLDDRIRKVSNGIITTVAGNGTRGFSGDGGPATQATLNGPADVAVDAAGNLYIADRYNLRIRKVSGGIITTIAGTGTGTFSGAGGPAASASLAAPNAVRIDSVGNLYVADNNRVLEISGGIINVFAGNGMTGFTGDGGPATSASLSGQIYGLALDSSGNLYIADSGDTGFATGSNRIREVLAAPASYQSTPSSLSFTATSGGAAPAAQTVTLSSSVAGLTYSTSVSAPWLSVNPSSGTIPASLQVSADPSQLAAGSYSAAVTIVAANASAPTQTIAVNFTVSAPPTGLLSLNPLSLSFSFNQGATSSNIQLTVANQGGGSIGFSAVAATSSGGNWLQVTPASGTATASSPVALTVTATPGTLQAGTYNGTVTVASASTGQQFIIPVTMAISAPPQKILLSQTGLTFTGVAQGGMPLSQSFGILNIGQGSMNWTATATTLSGGSGWLTLDVNSGNVATPYTSVSLVNVSVDPSQLAAGDYYGQIQVKAAGASNSPQTVAVILSVLPPGSSLGPELQPTGLIFTGAAGATPGSQDVRVGNPAAQATNFLSGSIGTGFTFAPTDAEVDPNQPTTVRVYPDFSALTPGSILRGTITLQFSDGTPRNVSILTVVAPSGGSSSNPEGERRLATGCTPTKLLPIFAQLGTGSSIPTGFPANITANVVDDCGSPQITGSVVASFSNGDPPLSLVSLQDGTWANSWQPLNSASVVAISLDAEIPTQNLSGQAQSTIGLAGSKTLPVYSSGVLGAATQTPGPLAPGDLVLLKGTGLADTQATGPLGQQLAGASLLIGGEYASLIYADLTQVIGIVPSDLAPNTSQQVLAQHDNNLGLPSPVIISATHPAVLSKDGSGLGQGLIYKSSGGVATVLADSSNPAGPGNTVIIYCTGLGLTDAKGNASNLPSVLIGGVQAQVTYAGLAPAANYPPSGAPSLLGGVASAALGGLYQITATLPMGVPNGQLVVIVSSAGQTSQSGVTLAVTGGAAGSGPAITTINTAYGSSGISQNDFIEIHGTNLAAAVAGPASLTTQLGGVSVMVNGKPALLYYVSPAQVNALTPLDSATGPVVVTLANNGVNTSYTANLQTVTPTFLRFDGNGDITATHADGTLLGPTSLGAAFTPAKPGETIVTYAVGFGLPSTAVVAGSPSQTGSLPALPICQVNGASATVAFAGLNGFAGLYQLNLVIPASAANGNNPVSCTYAGQTTAAGTLVSVQH